MVSTLLIGLLALSLVMLGYIYVGYPLLVVVMARLRPRPPHQSAITPALTLLIPAHNEAKVIAEKLTNARSLNYPPDKVQIIVTDDGSSDETAAIARGFEGVLVLSDGVRRGKVGALNRAIPHATGQIAIVSDADILLDADALRLLVRSFADEAVGCVVGKALMLKGDSTTAESGGIYWKYEAVIRKSESLIHSMVGASGALMAVRRSLLHPWPEGIILDDFYLATSVLKAGYRVVFDEDARCYERPTLAMTDEINRRRRMTAGRYQIISIAGSYLPHLSPLLVWKIVSHKYLRLTIPEWMILAYLSNALLLIAAPTPLWWALFAAQSAFYLAALAGRIAEGLGIQSRLLNVPYYLCATNFAALLGLLWYLSDNRTVLWQQARR